MTPVDTNKRVQPENEGQGTSLVYGSRFASATTLNDRKYVRIDVSVGFASIILMYDGT